MWAAKADAWNFIVEQMMVWMKDKVKPRAQQERGKEREWDQNWPQSLEFRC